MSFLHRYSYVYYFLNHYIYQPLISDRINELHRAQVDALSPVESRELYVRLVARMEEICRERGIGLLVAFAYERRDLLESEESPNRELMHALTNGGTHAIDLFGALRHEELSAERSPYYQENIQWNPSGHQAVARLLRRDVVTLLTDN